MNRQTLVLILLLASRAGLATTPAPYWWQCKLLDRVLVAMASDGTRGAALGILERVALGQADSIAPESGALIGIKPGELGDKGFLEGSVRARALFNLGDSGLPEVMEFLKGLRPSDFVSDRSGQAWRAAQIALRMTLLSRIEDSQSKVEFLKNVLVEPHDAAYNGNVKFWATEELCNMGASSALQDVRRAILSAGNAESEVQFCEARMQVLARDSGRMRALGSVLESTLRLKNTPAGTRLLTWAIDQLGSMHSAEARAEVDRFGDYMTLLLKANPTDSDLHELRYRIESIQRLRDQ